MTSQDKSNQKQEKDDPVSRTWNDHPADDYADKEIVENEVRDDGREKPLFP